MYLMPLFLMKVMATTLHSMVQFITIQSGKCVCVHQCLSVPVFLVHSVSSCVNEPYFLFHFVFLRCICFSSSAKYFALFNLNFFVVFNARAIA
jgi:hypothetical protein